MAGTQGVVTVEDMNGVSVAAATSLTLSQCAELLQGIERAAYCTPSHHMGGGTIGQHVRHSLDHFAAILTDSQAGHIDYDTRERGTPIETDPQAAIALIDRLVMRLDALEAGDLRAPVMVHVMLTGDGQQATLASTMGREIAFASHHAIHHHAMIASIAQELCISTSPGFGKAPSTVEFERRIATEH